MSGDPQQQPRQANNNEQLNTDEPKLTETVITVAKGDIVNGNFVRREETKLKNQHHSTNEGNKPNKKSTTPY